MSEYLAIKNWDKYQHYKDRNPPWIKLHRELLTSATWATADDASRVLAVSLMMLAAITGNKIPADKAYIKRVCYLNSSPDWGFLLSVDFIEIIEDRKRCKRVASKVVQVARPETETETETEESKKKPSSRSASTESLFEKAYDQYPRHVSKRPAQRAWLLAGVRHAKRLETIPKAEEMIYQRVMTYAAYCRSSGKDKQFIPHMATWLNQDRFMDDPSEWAVTTGGNHGNGTAKTADAGRANRNIQALVLSGMGAGVQRNDVPDGPAIQHRTPGGGAGNRGAGAVTTGEILAGKS